MLNANNTTSCEQVRELLFEYAEGVLDKPLCTSVEKHIEDCESCSQELEQARRILASLALAGTEPPSSLYKNVMAKIDGNAKEPIVIKPRRRFVHLGTAVAACAVLAVLIAGRHLILPGENIGVYDADGGVGMDVALGIVEDKDSPEYVLFCENTGLPEIGGVPEDAEPSGVGGVPEDTAVEVERISEAPKGENVHMTASTEETLEFTTAAVSVAAPSLDLSDKPNEYDDSNHMYSGTSGITLESVKAVIDSVYSMLTADDSAVVVCMESDFGWELPDFVKYITVNGIPVELYRTEENAMSTYLYLIECLDGEGYYYKTALPLSGDFSACELYLVDDTEN